MGDHQRGCPARGGAAGRPRCRAGGAVPSALGCALEGVEAFSLACDTEGAVADLDLLDRAVVELGILVAVASLQGRAAALPARRGEI